MNIINRARSNLDQLQLVTLESLYDTWQHPLAGSLFSKVVQLKLKGYLQEYNYGILPVDTTDFIATHHIVCRKASNELTPLMAYKSITYDKCTAHKIQFPALGLLAAPSLQNHREAIIHMIEECNQTGSGISYDCSWTIDPEIRKDRTFTQDLRNIFQTVHILFHEGHLPRTSLVCGVLRFKTDQFFKNWGYERLQFKGSDLPEFQHPSLYGETVVMMRATHFTDEAHSVISQYKRIWDQRILIQSDRAPQVKTLLREPA